jgi:hypothetical protein
MTKFTQKQLKEMVANGMAIDVSHASDRNEIPESYTQVGYATGVYGNAGKLLKGRDTGQLYADVAEHKLYIYFN